MALTNVSFSFCDGQCRPTNRAIYNVCFRRARIVDFKNVHWEYPVTNLNTRALPSSPHLHITCEQWCRLCIAPMIRDFNVDFLTIFKFKHGFLHHRISGVSQSEAIVCGGRLGRQSTSKSNNLANWWLWSKISQSNRLKITRRFDGIDQKWSSSGFETRISYSILSKLAFIGNR